MKKTRKQLRAEYKKAVKALSSLNTAFKPTGKPAAQKPQVESETEQQRVYREGRM